jgi:hypothetical protein
MIGSWFKLQNEVCRYCGEGNVQHRSRSWDYVNKFGYISLAYMWCPSCLKRYDISVEMDFCTLFDGVRAELELPENTDIGYKYLMLVDASPYEVGFERLYNYLDKWKDWLILQGYLTLKPFSELEYDWY